MQLRLNRRRSYQAFGRAGAIAAIENVIYKHEKEQNALTSKDEFMNLQLLYL
jgi:hypothetical protein